MNATYNQSAEKWNGATEHSGKIKNAFHRRRYTLWWCGYGLGFWFSWG